MTVAPQWVGPSSSSGGPAPSLDWEEVLADIGDRVRAERQARGWTETGLAERAHVDRDTVRRIQHGQGQLRALLQVCAALKVDVAYLLSSSWEMPEPVRDTRPRLSPVQVTVLRAAAGGASLAQLAGELSMTAPAVGSVLTRVYQRLGVTHLPRNERRSGAVRVAMQHGLFDPQNRTS